MAKYRVKTMKAEVFKNCVTNNINKYMTAIVALEGKALKRALVINSRIENPFMTGVIMERITELKRRMQKEVVEIEFRKRMALSPVDLPPLWVRWRNNTSMAEVFQAMIEML